MSIQLNRTRRRCVAMAAALLVLLASSLRSAGASAPAGEVGEPSRYVRAAGIFDAEQGRMRVGVALELRGERVIAVIPATDLPLDAQDSLQVFEGAYIVPGLIDAHVHLLHDPKVHGYRRLGQSLPERTLIGAINAQRTLQAGVTTVRVLGAPGYGDIALRDAIARGDLPGPRIIAAGLGIGITGGHCTNNNLLPFGARAETLSGATADGPWAMRARVRQNIKFGADVIKTCSTGGVLSKGTEPGAPQGTVEELRALVEEAHAHGRKVASHAHGATGIRNALIAGVDSIEHASYIDAEGIRLAKRAGAKLVMDIYVTEYILNEGKAAGILRESLEKERQVGQIQRENFRRAHRAGVPIVFGTDAGVYPHGDNLKQLSRMVDWGMTPAAALQSATVHAADLLGLAGEVGALVPGAFADFVVTRANPLDDITTLEAPVAVFKSGQAVP